MKLEQIGLQVGDSLQVQLLSDDNARYSVKVVGYVAGKTLITTAAYVEPNRLAQIREGQIVIVRFAVLNAVTGFKAKVMAVRNIPYPYMHLSMPDDIEMLEVRKAHRVNVEVETTVSSAKSKQSMRAKIVDLSPVGAGIICPKKVGEVGEKVHFTFDACIADIERVLVMQGIIRTVNAVKAKEYHDKSAVSHGIQIVKGDEEDMVSLYALVYQTLLQQMHVL